MKKDVTTLYYPTFEQRNQQQANKNENLRQESVYTRSASRDESEEKRFSATLANPQFGKCNPFNSTSRILHCLLFAERRFNGTHFAY